MSKALGLSIGAANLVASGAGSPTVRRSVLTLFPHRPAEVGVVSENQRLNEPGLVLTDFVDRVGDPVPLVASDGSTHSGGQLVAEALESLTRSVAVSGRPESIAVSVPAYWRPNTVDALRTEMLGRPGLAVRAGSLTLVPDAAASLTALQAHVGLPARGIVLLCDFGAAGTTITLADAGAGFRIIGDAVRYDDFSGDLIDQAVLRHVLAGVDFDAASTSAVGALGELRDQCRRAKERLSLETATVLTGSLSVRQGTIRLTRPELESLLRDPADGLLGAVEDTLQRNNIRGAAVVAVATAGGGARIPFVTQRLSEMMRLPITTAPHAQFLAAVGAALAAGRRPEEQAATRLAPAAPVARAAGLAQPMLVAAAAAWGPAGTANEHQPLAWSEVPADEMDDYAYIDYAGTTYAGTTYAGTDDAGADGVENARPAVHFARAKNSKNDVPLPLPWYLRPTLLFGAAACAVLVGTVGLVATVHANHRNEPTAPVGAASSILPTASPNADVPPPVISPDASPAPVAAPQAFAPVVDAAPTQAPVVVYSRQPVQHYVAPPPPPPDPIPVDNARVVSGPSWAPPVDVFPPSGNPTGGVPSGSGQNAGGPSEGAPSGGTPSGSNPGGAGPSDGAPSGGAANGGAPAGGNGAPSGGNPSGGKPSGSNPKGGTPAGGKGSSGGGNPGGGKPSGAGDQGAGPSAGAPSDGGTPKGGTQITLTPSIPQKQLLCLVDPSAPACH